MLVDSCGCISLRGSLRGREEGDTASEGRGENGFENDNP